MVRVHGQKEMLDYRQLQSTAYPEQGPLVTFTLSRSCCRLYRGGLIDLPSVTTCDTADLLPLICCFNGATHPGTPLG
jgi:hypothetical protein